ncbi:unnamed protein product [Heligmosomoides polygyrus]|uniref:Reverse transcriptase domain-containing protein n=1 Tax=Heligmosomoides polygyrus TaxID=6339 RepID=A0A183FWE9_HELPZ|nr:unnamed protein product [Heligmosomoides polygyrus]
MKNSLVEKSKKNNQRKDPSHPGRRKRLIRKPCYMAFLDFEKAYERLPWAVLWKSLRGGGVPERLITFVKDMYEDPKAAV